MTKNVPTVMHLHSELCSRRNFFKLSGLAALGIGGTMVLSGCGPAAQNSTDDTSEPSDNANDAASAETLGDGVTLRVGMEAAYAPYNWQVSEASDTTIPIENVEGAYADGYDVQIAKRIAEGLGMEAVAVKMSFGTLIDALNSGQVDIVCAGMSVTPERAESADFSDSYLDDNISLVVKKDSPYASATSLEEFAGTAVLGQKSTMFDEVIDQIPDVNHMTPVDTIPNVVENIQNGACDAITYSTMSLPRLLEDYPNLVEVQLEKGFEGAEMPDNAGIAKGQEAALAKVNEIIGGISDEERQEIWNGCMDRQPA